MPRPSWAATSNCCVGNEFRLEPMRRNAKVGIDLTPCARRDVPGTARYVREQAETLLRMDVPWSWVPLVTRGDTETADMAARFNPDFVPPCGRLMQGVWYAGRLLGRRKVDAAFFTAYIAPIITMPFVVNAFDSNVYEPVDQWFRRRRPIRHRIYRAVVSHGLTQARRVFVPSQYVARRLAVVCPAVRGKLLVTPPGLPDVKHACAADRPRWLGDAVTRFVLYLGAVSENKNQLNLVRAWRRLQSTSKDLPCLVLAGPAPQDYVRAVLQPEIQGLSRPDQVYVPGCVSERERQWLLWNAWAYVQPSFAEGFGLPVAEAMACGVPVACSHSTALPETAGDAAVYFDPGNPGDMANKVWSVVSDPSLRNRAVAMGREQAARFTWQRNAEQVAGAIDAELSVLTHATRDLT